MPVVNASRVVCKALSECLMLYLDPSEPGEFELSIALRLRCDHDL